MDKDTQKENLLKIIQEAKTRVMDGYKIWSYKDISEKRKKGLLSFDPHFFFDDFVAIYDTTIFESAKDGIVFMIDGMYIPDSDFSGKRYINYKDIDSMTVIKGFLGGLEIIAEVITYEDRSDGRYQITTTHTMKVSNTIFNPSQLKNLLESIKTLTATWNSGVENGKITGKINEELNLTDSEKAKCHGIIHTASVAAGGVGTGLAQIPLSDNVVLAPIQIAMITSLGAVFGIRVTEGVAKGILTTLAASFVGRGVSQVLVGWIPFLGNAINTATAAGITEAVGWTAVKHFKELQRQDKQKGRFEGMKEGYQKASYEYEKKFKKQAESFIQQKKVYEREKEGFLKLIDDYEQLIIELQVELSKNYSSQIKSQIDEMTTELNMLKVLPIV